MAFSSLSSCNASNQTTQANFWKQASSSVRSRSNFCLADLRRESVRSVTIIIKKQSIQWWIMSLTNLRLPPQLIPLSSPFGPPSKILMASWQGNFQTFLKNMWPEPQSTPSESCLNNLSQLAVHPIGSSASHFHLRAGWANFVVKWFNCKNYVFLRAELSRIIQWTPKVWAERISSKGQVQNQHLIRLHSFICHVLTSS